MKQRIIPIMICILLCSVVNIQMIQCQAEDDGNIYYIDSSYKGYSKGTAEQPFKTIQEAIDYASSGDTLYVFGGLYEEIITIDKKLQLWGSIEGKESKIQADDDRRNTVTITADYVEIQDFTFSDEYGIKTSPIGALISISAENVVITGNLFNNTDSRGIYVDSTADGTIITGNQINNTEYGVYIDGASTNDIVNNIITDCSNSGVYLTQSSNNRLHENEIETCLNGINAISQVDINISNNTFYGNEYADIHLNLCSSPLIEANEFNENTGSGIYFSADHGTIQKNIFEDSQRGITLAGTSSTIIDNTFINCTGAGIYAISNSQLNLIYNNTFEENGKTAEEHGDNTWYQETLMMGNYWDDYGWIDRNKDGIGDIVYNRNGLTDIYPLGYFLKSPVKPSDPTPEDGETGVGLKPKLKIKVNDDDSETIDVYFYNGETDTLIGEDIRIASGKYANMDLRLDFDRTYAWYVIVNDSVQENRSDTFFFTTMVTPPDNIPPVADAGGPYTVALNESIYFDASNSTDADGNIDFYRWNFGDGTSELLAEQPIHTYKQSGIYTVTLTVIDNLGAIDQEVFSVAVGVSPNKPPVAQPNGPYNGRAGSSIVFDGSASTDADGNITAYTWNFGDGTEGTGSVISHTYETAGSYQVILTVTDNHGDSNAEITTATIDPKKQESPGFEIILLICAALFIIYRKRSYLKK